MELYVLNFNKYKKKIQKILRSSRICMRAQISVVAVGDHINRDLKQTGRQRDDDGYSHNDIPDFVQKK